jgi:hypothetical protein
LASCFSIVCVGFHLIGLDEPPVDWQNTSNHQKAQSLLGIAKEHHGQWLGTGWQRGGYQPCLAVLAGPSG